ncbi:MAG: DUF2933 domain-containing protein [Gammaproteobacteria bacterium]|nr:DUF2933 domain-containing protein [Gammaproteobacteria bacterium]
MDWLGENAFFIIVLLLCVGMHFFHGHGHHNDKSVDRHDRNKHQ